MMLLRYVGKEDATGPDKDYIYVCAVYTDDNEELIWVKWVDYRPGKNLRRCYENLADLHNEWKDV